MRMWYFKTKDNEEYALESWYNKEGYIFSEDESKALELLHYHLGEEREIDEWCELKEKKLFACIVSQTPQCGNYDWDVM